MGSAGANQKLVQAAITPVGAAAGASLAGADWDGNVFIGDASPKLAVSSLKASGGGSLPYSTAGVTGSREMRTTSAVAAPGVSRQGPDGVGHGPAGPPSRTAA